VVPAEVLLESAAKPRPMADGVCGRRVGLPCRHAGAWAPPLTGNAFFRSYLLDSPVRSEWSFQAVQERRLDRVGAARSTPQTGHMATTYCPKAESRAPSRRASTRRHLSASISTPWVTGWLSHALRVIGTSGGGGGGVGVGASGFSPAPLGPLARYSQACSGPSHALAPLTAS
jgi:hypothetical protein